MRLLLAALLLTAVALLTRAVTRPAESRTLAVIPVPARADVPRPPPAAGDASPRAWRVRLRLDPELAPPGPAWRMREGLGEAAGYELAWQPASRHLVLSRPAPLPLILGMAPLRGMPREVVWQRQGARLLVVVDGRPVLDGLDPEGPEEAGAWWPNGWSVIGGGPLGDSVLTIEELTEPLSADADDVPARDREALRRALARGPADPGERERIGWPTIVPGRPGWRPDPPPGRPDHALLAVRRALLALERGEGSPWPAFAAAGRAVSALASGHRDQERLALWLGWGETRHALRTPPSAAADIEAGRGALAALAQAVRSRTHPEAPGLLMALLPALAEQALRRPGSPRPAAQVLAERRAWLGLLSEAAQALLDGGPRPVPRPQQQALLLVQHASAALGAAGVRPRPLPAEAPAWLAARWRLFAGGPPPPGALPPLPADDPLLAPLTPAIAALQRGAVFEPLAAVRLTAAVLDPAADEEEQRRAFEAAGRREARLAALIVALRRLAEAEAAAAPAPEALVAALRDVERAAEPLGPVDGRRAPDEEAPVRHDPLSFALACLAESRLQRHRPPGMQREPWRPPEPGTGPYARLAPFARLLSADPAGSELIWLHDDQVLPPAWALAAHLAMREVHARTQGGAMAADWEQLAQLRCFTLPLALLAPVPAAAGPLRGTPAP